MLLDFLSEHAFALQQKILEHIALTGLSLLMAVAIAIPVGVGISRVSQLSKVILSAGSVSQTIPCIAMLGLLIPFLGLGNIPTVIVLTFYAIYPILKSTYIGLKSVPREYLEAAKGLGFSLFQKLWFVELPLALPVIISGLRVATAMTIGITSIAALVGAGGLGDFIMQGIALNSSSLILLGAIPAAFLAIAFDYLISQIESRLQSRKETTFRFSNAQKSSLILFGILTVIGVGIFCYNNYTNKKEHSVVIASKNFAESIILAEMMAQLIEAKTSLNVVRKFNLGASSIIHQAMLKKEVDLYPEYTGTAYLTILQNTLIPGMESLFQDVQLAYKNKFNFTWLEPFGFSNTQALAVNLEDAQRHRIHTVSDLARISPTLTIAAPAEFLKRLDALPGLFQAYGLKFKRVLQVDPNLMYSALKNKTVEVIAVFSTDGKLRKHNLLTLVDDKKFYPSYEAAPVVRQSVLEAHPEIYQALSPLFGFMSQEKMMELNDQVDGEGRSPAEVVRQFLLKYNLIGSGVH